MEVPPAMTNIPWGGAGYADAQAGTNIFSSWLIAAPGLSRHKELGMYQSNKEI